MKTLTQLLDLHEGDFAIHDGTLWLPRPYSSEDAPRNNDYVPAIKLQSFADQFEKMYPEEYQQLRQQVLTVSQNTHSDQVPRALCDTIFEILPHFVKVLPGLERRKPTKEEILNYICAKTQIPEKYFGEQQNMDYDGLTRGLKSKVVPVRFSEGNINNAFTQAVTNNILAVEIERLKNDKTARDEAKKRADTHNALLRYLSRAPHFEIDGFGFQEGDGEDMIIYKRISEYALKDFDGRIYLFPECRVGVYFGNGSDPLVIENYQHPFLPDYASNQTICVGEADISGDDDAEYMINAIDAGITALQQGYFRSGDHFGGYHTLSGDHHFGDEDRVSFASQRISRNHQKIRSGGVQITNDALIRR